MKSDTWFVVLGAVSGGALAFLGAPLNTPIYWVSVVTMVLAYILGRMSAR